MPDIEFDLEDDGAAVLTLNRPQVRNALNWAAMEAFGEAVARAWQAALEGRLRALVVTGAGEAFASGGDLGELQHYPAPADGERLASTMGDALARLEALPVPTVAALNGPARGGGAEIAVACDLRVLDERADLGFVHGRLGIIPGWGGGQRLLRLVGYARALELLATARVMAAAEAFRLGLANAVVPAGEALAAARALAGRIAENPPSAVQAAKRILRAGLCLPLEQALAAERAEFPALWATDFRLEAMRKFLGRGK